MRGSLRVHSLLGAAAFVAWALLAEVRERVSLHLQPTAHTTRPPVARAPAGPPTVVDPRLWN
jgi:hypothetical protein